MDNIPRSGSGGIVPAAPAVARTGSNSTASVGASTPQRRPMPPTTRETPKRSTGSGGLPPVIPSLSATSTGSGGSDFSGCPVPNRTATPVNVTASSSPIIQVSTEDSSSVSSSGNAPATPAMPDLSSKSTNTPQTLNPKMTTNASAGTATATPLSQPLRTPNTAQDGQVLKSRVTVQDGVVSRDGVVLGLEALERQQAEMEKRRRMQEPYLQQRPPQQYPSTTTPNPTPHPSVRHPGSIMTPAGGARLDDDDNTEPSSTMTSTQSNNNNNIPRPGTVHSQNRESSFTKFIRKRLNSIENFNNNDNNNENNSPSNNPALDEDDDVASSSGALIYGYLLKMGRNGKWQRRFFETDGECLSYYKNRHRTKLLAQLDLCKVGEIAIDEDDQSGCTFQIQVANRPYALRAENSGTCKDWVITLNRVKEARMHIGGFELITPFKAPPDLLDHNEQMKATANDEEEEFAGATPRVVLRANRQRTRAVVDQNVKTWDQLVQVADGAPPDLISGSPMASRKSGMVAMAGEQDLEEDQEVIMTHLPPQVMARWEKRRSLVYSMGRKIVRWARRVRELRCSADESDVHLDSRVHPPGHDDVKKPQVSVQTKQQTLDRQGGDVGSVVSAGSGSVGSGSAQNYGSGSGSDSSVGPQSPTNSFRDAVKYSEWIGKETEISKKQKGGVVPIDPQQPNTLQKNPSGSSHEEEDDEEETRELS